MKILVLAQQLTPRDGWGTLALTTVQGLAARGHEVVALVQTADASLPFTQREVLPAPLSLLSNPLSWYRTSRAVAKELKRFEPSLIHVLTEPYALGLALGRKNRLPPWLLTACGTYAVEPLGIVSCRFLMRRAYAHASRVLAISRYTRHRVIEELQPHYPALAAAVAAKTTVWTLGIAQPPPPPARIARTEKRLLFVGALKPRKGIREIIEACGMFRRESLLPFHLDLIGDCPVNAYTDSLRARVRELGLESMVTFHGHVPEAALAQHYADADLFLMLSTVHGYHFEGFGLVFLEANARGVPVIGPGDSGCADAIADGRSGYLVDPADAAMASLRMRWILEEGRIHPEDCRAWAREHGIERQTAELEQAYAAVLDARMR